MKDYEELRQLSGMNEEDFEKLKAIVGTKGPRRNTDTGTAELIRKTQKKNRKQEMQDKKEGTCRALNTAPRRYCLGCRLIKHKAKAQRERRKAPRKESERNRVANAIRRGDKVEIRKEKNRVFARSMGKEELAELDERLGEGRAAWECKDGKCVVRPCARAVLRSRQRLAAKTATSWKMLQGSTKANRLRIAVGLTANMTTS